MNQGLPELESHVLSLIQEGLLSQDIDASRAKSIAAAVLASLKPDMTGFQLYQAASSLNERFPEVAPIVAEAGAFYEDAVRDAVASHVADLIQRGNLEEASTLAGTAIEKSQEIRIDG